MHQFTGLERNLSRKIRCMRSLWKVTVKDKEGRIMRRLEIIKIMIRFDICERREEKKRMNSEELQTAVFS